MASEFLQHRQPQFIEEMAGLETVSYVKFDASAKDATTGDVDEDAAYAADPIDLPALVEFSPSQAMREKIGLEIDFEAIVTISLSHLEAATVTLSIGDSLTLPGHDKAHYVTKIVPEQQCGGTYLRRMIAVARRRGRRD